MNGRPALRVVGLVDDGHSGRETARTPRVGWGVRRFERFFTHWTVVRLRTGTRLGVTAEERPNDPKDSHPVYYWAIQRNNSSERRAEFESVGRYVFVAAREGPLRPVRPAEAEQ